MNLIKHRICCQGGQGQTVPGQEQIHVRSEHRVREQRRRRVPVDALLRVRAMPA